MVHILADENIEIALVVAILRSEPAFDIVTVDDMELRSTPDQEILDWAAEGDRLILTHDRQTLVGYAYERIKAGRPMPGVLILRNDFSFAAVVEELLLMNSCSEQAEYQAQIIWLES